SMGNTYGFGSSAKTHPSLPTASAKGMVESPVCAPISIATSPGRRNLRNSSTDCCVISFSVSLGCSHWAYSTAPSFGRSNCLSLYPYVFGPGLTPKKYGNSLSFTAHTSGDMISARAALFNTSILPDGTAGSNHGDGKC